ncbi:hypothetical protein FQN57_001276 [Myotisia sp. PD_48]|nr:hypothetical protein FQN57_001276 [Myotisia sp. PD_48]
MPPQLSTLPEDFLRGPPASRPIIRPIHFAQTPLDAYGGCYAIVIDNVLSPVECDQLLRAAEATAEGKWADAQINIGGGKQETSKDVRDSGRIIWDSETVTQRIWDRVKPHLESRLSEHAEPFLEGLAEDVQSIERGRTDGVEFIGQDENIISPLFDTGIGCMSKDAVADLGVWLKQDHKHWVCKGLNPRMRFLKYQDQQYFKPHIDGPYVVPGSNRTKRTMFTLHLYLNEASPTNPLKGGATTFFSELPRYWDQKDQAKRKVKEMNVVPRTGRVLVFQHESLVHSGEDVAGGVKYTMRTDIMYHAEGFPGDENGN